MLPHRSQKKAPWFHFLHFQGSLKSKNQEGKERSTQRSKANQSRCQKVRSGAKFPGCYSRSPAPADSCRPLLVPSPPQGHSPRRRAGAGRGWPQGLGGPTASSPHISLGEKESGEACIALQGRLLRVWYGVCWLIRLHRLSHQQLQSPRGGGRKQPSRASSSPKGTR